MKLKKLGLLALLAFSPMVGLTACSGCSIEQENESESVNPEDIPEGYVRVFFYVDFTQPDTGECLEHQDVLPGAKIKAPVTPYAPFQEFPNFLGWSYKELINSKSDLWNFDTDVIQVEEGVNTYNIYGIWGAEGETA